MSDSPDVTTQRSIWLRALLMLLMAVAFQLAATVLCALAVLQFVLALISAPNERLRHFGRGLGRYLGQIASFVSFATEETPFPFKDWPGND